jgi:hypothetical protein
MGIKKKVLVGTIGLTLFTSGAMAGTVIQSYKTPRGNIATVEREDIHKNRIGITVNGQKVKKDTWYSNDVTYAPLRDVSEILGAEVNYNSKTMSADIIFEGYSQKDISHIKSVNKLNQTIGFTHDINNRFSDFVYSLILAFTNILANDVDDGILNAIDQLNESISLYNTTIDYINIRQDEVREAGYLTQNDIDQANEILNNIYYSIEEYKLGIENMINFLETNNNVYVDKFAIHSSKGQDYALKASSLTLDAQRYYFGEIENYSNNNARVSTASDLIFPEYKKIIPYKKD